MARIAFFVKALQLQAYYLTILLLFSIRPNCSNAARTWSQSIFCRGPLPFNGPGQSLNHYDSFGMDWMTHVELYGIVDESPWPDLTSLCARYDQITSPGKYSPSKTPTITRGAWQYNLDMVCNAGEVVPGPENEYKLPSRWKKGGPGKAQRDDARNWCKERCWCVDSWTNFAQAATNSVGEDGKVVVQKVKEYFDNEMVRAKAEREEQIRLWRLRHDQRIIPTNWYKDRGPRGRDQNLVNDPGREPDRGHIS